MTPLYRHTLPQLAGGGQLKYLTDAGIETDLIHHHGVKLEEFAAFPLLEEEHGRELLVDYYLGHGQLAGRFGLGFILDTITWRAGPAWGQRLGYDDQRLAAANRAAVDLGAELRESLAPAVEPVILNGVIGPRDDGYQPASAMTASQAERYHRWQVDVLADTDIDMVTALTLPDVAQTVGLARAAAARQIPFVPSFTVETDGRLPDGTALATAVATVDRETEGYPAYYMINCAHPDHFRQALDPGEAWTQRLRGVRVNASLRSHAELDEAADLDEGDPEALGLAVGELARALPALVVFGGCCGTDLRHVAEIAAAVRDG